MPYLGNVPAEAYSQISYQDLTGGSGTSFTLDYPVGNENEIEVFVNNVRQEPTVAYTTAGTALTMTGTIAATDDFYVVFQGKAQQTIGIPEKQTNGDYNFDSGTLFVDASTNQIGMGTTSPATATGGGIDIEKAGGASVRLDDTTNSVTGELQVYSSGMNLATATNHNIIISPNNSEIARFTTDGLTFNGDTAAANALDDYEEGTWTGSLGAAYGFTPGGSATYNGNYVKIGNILTVNVSVDFDTSETLALGDRFIIQGVPFTMTGSVNGVGGGSFLQPGSFASGTHAVGTAASNSQSQDEIMCVVSRVNGTPPALNATNVNIGITYILTNTF